MRLRARFALFALLMTAPAIADVTPFPPSFKSQDIAVNGTVLHVRVGGAGPAVVLLHGYGETGDMWEPLAAQLSKDHRVIVPDLRGMGLSARASTGFDKNNEAEDISQLMDKLGARHADVVAHDIGNMVAFALAARHGDKVTKLVVMDAPIPGIGPWDEILKNPLLWHFRFGGPDMERLVAGRERIYLDRFWNEFSAHPAKFDEASRQHYAALYARPGNMHAGFAQFAAFDKDAADNRAWASTGKRLAMQVLAVGGDHSFGPMMAQVMRFAADDVHQQVIKDSGHWLMEEQPDATTAAIRQFLGPQEAPKALDSGTINGMARAGAGVGTSGVKGIQTVILSGDPSKPGPYAIQIRVPPHTTIAAHSHRDDRFGTVVSGSWYFGYGAEANPGRVTALSPGAFYTEPAGQPHFALTRDAPAVVTITGNGPSDTIFVGAKK